MHKSQLFILFVHYDNVHFYLFQSIVTIFTMNKHITPHMVEKLDRSAYVHEVKKEEGDDNVNDSNDASDSEATEDEEDTDNEEDESD